MSGTGFLRPVLGHGERIEHKGEQGGRTSGDSLQKGAEGDCPLPYRNVLQQQLAHCFLIN